MEAFFKWSALSLFVLQNSGVILLMRYSQLYPASDGVGYSTAVIVFVTECAKFPVCLLFYAIECGGPCASVVSVAKDCRSNFCEWMKLALPALLYTVQNNALFVGLANLEATVAQVTYQGKIFTTALFAVCMLGQRLKMSQWTALVLLSLGVLCVQGAPAKLAAKLLDRYHHHGRLLKQSTDAAADPFVGLVAMLIACLCSSFASGERSLCASTCSHQLFASLNALTNVLSASLPAQSISR